MSKEWLKKVKDKWDYAYESGKDGGYLDIEDIEGLLDRAELSYRLESEIDDLSMAHDSLHRELSTYKESLPKDKHTLIKSVISLNKRVQELEKRLKIYQKRSWFEDYEKVAKQNKRYREAIEETLQAMGMVDRQKYGKTLELALEESE